ncbi:hypothetical protein UFOVP207_26 [uncultured Caudovirales phage]|uniref:Uncharacterized protein n=1 Tax=uncultured Caudovirales phage TaxID=2100421 RepID=A0A6J7WJ06_9CAUD|nr:hypothetical protein UFOVP207_26 [uncultured Caudovirales phage]
MILLRTDGGGSSFNDERLIVVKNHLKFHYRDCLNSKIFKLHDHKGCLNVFWIGLPFQEDIDYIKGVWESFCEHELTHYYSSFKEISNGL